MNNVSHTVMWCESNLRNKRPEKHSFLTILLTKFGYKLWINRRIWQIIHIIFVPYRIEYK